MNVSCHYFLKFHYIYLYGCLTLPQIKLSCPFVFPSLQLNVLHTIGIWYPFVSEWEKRSSQRLALRTQEFLAPWEVLGFVLTSKANERFLGTIWKLTKCSTFWKSAWELIIQGTVLIWENWLVWFWTSFSSFFLPGTPRIFQKVNTLNIYIEHKEVKVSIPTYGNSLFPKCD
jgi:hypothetical protein